MRLGYQRSRGLLQIIGRFVLLICFFVFVSQIIFPGSISVTGLSILALVATIAQILVLATNTTIYNSGLLMIFYLYTALVHNGFVIAHLFDPSYSTFQSARSMSFLQNQYYPEAIVIANIIICCFVFSADLIVGEPSYYEKGNYSNVQEYEGDKWVDIVGIGALLFGTIYLGYLVLTGGLWLAGYINSLAFVENNTFYAHTVVITSLAMALLMSTGSRNGVRIGLALFAVDAVLHFSIGNRGEVMYAAVVCFALYSIRYKKIRLKHILLAGLGIVILIPLVRVSRELRIDAYTFNPFKSFLDVLCEEGIEISPFTYIVQYVQSGHNHVWGMTYISGFQDFIMRRFGSTGSFLQEQYVIRSIMPFDGMGFTMAAELYYNFTTVGAALIYIVFAQLIKKLDSEFYYDRLSETKRIFLAMLMVEMINLTRNDSSTLPLYLIWTLFLIAVCRILGKTTRREKTSAL